MVLVVCASAAGACLSTDALWYWLCVLMLLVFVFSKFLQRALPAGERPMTPASQEMFVKLLCAIKQVEKLQRPETVRFTVFALLPTACDYIYSRFLCVGACKFLYLYY